VTADSIEDVLARHAHRWLALDGVVGTAIGQHEGCPCIQVYTSGDSSALAGAIPEEVEGYRVVFIESGHFRALGGK